MVFGVQEITLAIIIGTLAAIVYSLRILVLMERRIARIEMHIERVVDKVVKEEIRIEKGLKYNTTNAPNWVKAWNAANPYLKEDIVDLESPEQSINQSSNNSH